SVWPSEQCRRHLDHADYRHERVMLHGATSGLHCLMSTDPSCPVTKPSSGFEHVAEASTHGPRPALTILGMALKQAIKRPKPRAGDRAGPLAHSAAGVRPARVAG